jgi:hypothetical protein
MAKKIINLITVEREKLDDFCDKLPEPFVAKPIVKPVRGSRGRRLTLGLEYPGTFAEIIENREPCIFPSIDMIVAELDGMPNVDVSELMPKTAYWQYAHPV